MHLSVAPVFFYTGSALPGFLFYLFYGDGYYAALAALPLFSMDNPPGLPPSRHALSSSSPVRLFWPPRLLASGLLLPFFICFRFLLLAAVDLEPQLLGLQLLLQFFRLFGLRGSVEI